jgi:hypothetical protein
MLEVAKLEEDCGVGDTCGHMQREVNLTIGQFQRLSNTMDCRAVQLVKPETRTGKEGDKTPSGGPNLPGFIAASAQVGSDPKTIAQIATLTIHIFTGLHIWVERQLGVDCEDGEMH